MGDKNQTNPNISEKLLKSTSPTSPSKNAVKGLLKEDSLTIPSPANSGETPRSSLFFKIFDFFSPIYPNSPRDSRGSSSEGTRERQSDHLSAIPSHILLQACSNESQNHLLQLDLATAIFQAAQSAAHTNAHPPTKGLSFASPSAAHAPPATERGPSPLMEQKVNFDSAPDSRPSPSLSSSLTSSSDQIGAQPSEFGPVELMVPNLNQDARSDHFNIKATSSFAPILCQTEIVEEWNNLVRGLKASLVSFEKKEYVATSSKPPDQHLLVSPQSMHRTPLQSTDPVLQKTKVKSQQISETQKLVGSQPNEKQQPTNSAEHQQKEPSETLNKKTALWKSKTNLVLLRASMEFGASEFSEEMLNATKLRGIFGFETAPRVSVGENWNSGIREKFCLAQLDPNSRVIYEKYEEDHIPLSVQLDSCCVEKFCENADGSVSLFKRSTFHSSVPVVEQKPLTEINPYQSSFFDFAELGSLGSEKVQKSMQDEKNSSYEYNPYQVTKRIDILLNGITLRRTPKGGLLLTGVSCVDLPKCGEQSSFLCSAYLIFNYFKSLVRILTPANPYLDNIFFDRSPLSNFAFEGASILIDLFNNKSIWKYVTTDHEIDIFTGQGSSSLSLSMGLGHIDAPVPVLRRLISQIGESAKWNTLIDHALSISKSDFLTHQRGKLYFRQDVKSELQKTPTQLEFEALPPQTAIWHAVYHTQKCLMTLKRQILFIAQQRYNAVDGSWVLSSRSLPPLYQSFDQPNHTNNNNTNNQNNSNNTNSNNTNNNNTNNNNTNNNTNNNNTNNNTDNQNNKIHNSNKTFHTDPPSTHNFQEIAEKVSLHHNCDPTITTAKLHVGGWLLRKAAKGGTHVAYLAEIDLCGLPQMVMKAVALRIPLTIHGLKKYAMEQMALQNEE